MTDIFSLLLNDNNAEIVKQQNIIRNALIAIAELFGCFTETDNLFYIKQVIYFSLIKRGSLYPYLLFFV
jgi:hypothetical protein